VEEDAPQEDEDAGFPQDEKELEELPQLCDEELEVGLTHDEDEELELGVPYSEVELEDLLHSCHEVEVGVDKEELAEADVEDDQFSDSVLGSLFATPPIAAPANARRKRVAWTIVIESLTDVLETDRTVYFQKELEKGDITEDQSKRDNLEISKNRQGKGRHDNV
jgi:hypothetical protein